MTSPTSECVLAARVRRSRGPDPLVRPARALLQRAGPAGHRRAGIAPRRCSRPTPRSPGCIIRSAQARRASAPGSTSSRSLACETAAEVEHLLRRGLAVIDRLAVAGDPHGRDHPRRLPGRRTGAGPGLPAPRGARLGRALAGGLPEIHLGLVPAWGGITRLPRIDRPRGGARPAPHRPIDRVSPRTVARAGRPAGLRGRPGRVARPAGSARRRGTRPIERSLVRLLERARERIGRSARRVSPRSRSASSRSSRWTSSAGPRRRRRRPSRRSPSWPCPPRRASRSPGSSSASGMPSFSLISWAPHPPTGRGPCSRPPIDSITSRARLNQRGPASRIALSAVATISVVP